MIAGDRVAAAFVEAADTLVADFDIVEFVQSLVARTADLLDTRAVGLLLADGHGRLQLMAASCQEASMLELFQVQQAEGPCQDCFRLGIAVVNADLTSAAGRWPEFAPRAVAAGYQSVHAFPLRLRNEVIGVLNLFGTDPGKIDPADVRVIQALADVATIGLIHERALRASDQLSGQLQGALDSRVRVEQAKGVLAQIHGTDVDEAFSRLRAYCRRNHLRLAEIALEVVTDPNSVPALTAPALG
jgi:GAF domain-containing protein